METKSETKSVKKLKKINYKPLALEIAKTIGFSLLTGFCMALGSQVHSSMMKNQRGNLVAIDGGRQSAAM